MKLLDVIAMGVSQKSNTVLSANTVQQIILAHADQVYKK